MTLDSIPAVLDASRRSQTTYVGTHTSLLGVDEHVGIPDTQRVRHVLSTGPTGVGKTQVMVHAVVQDVAKGHGCCLLVLKGDAIDQVLANLPESRRADVHYFNPARDSIPALNVLQPAVTPGMTRQQLDHQKEIIVSDVIALFKRQSETWGDRFGRILETLLRAHLDLNLRAGETRTLVDVFRCVVTPDALGDLIDRTADPIVRDQLIRVREDLTRSQLEPLQRRLNDFVMNTTIRAVIGGSECSLDFQEALATNQILLVELQKGELGGTVAELVGSLVLTKLWTAAQSQIALPPHQRQPFFLYVDELQNFASEGSSLATLLAEAREYKLGCWFATQYLAKLGSTTLADALLTNCRSKLLFAPTAAPDTKLYTSIPDLDSATVRRLGQYQGLLHTPAGHAPARPTIVSTYEPWPGDRDRIPILKAQCAVGGAEATASDVPLALGQGQNAGGEQHTALLDQAKAHLEERGCRVDLCYQGAGETKPDGLVTMPDGSIAHLEAEQATLSKPAKVLTNLLRADAAGRECLFVVEDGNATRVAAILQDPVNRRGTTHRDEQGRFDYYQDTDGAFTEIERVKRVPYRILELQADDLLVHSHPAAVECPELDHADRDALETFCLYRVDGICTELDRPCPLLDDQ